MAVEQTRAETFFAAIKAGDRGAVEAFLAADPDLIQAETEDGLGPVVLAKYYGEDEIADFLLQRGARLDPFAAAMVGQSEVVRAALTDDPAIVRAYSTDGWTMLHLAAYFGHYEIAELLIDAGADVRAFSTNDQANTPLHAALPHRNREIAVLLLARGADVNARQAHSFTPLHEAALIGDVSIARLLVERGADPEVKTNNGETPLDLATRENQHEVVQLLQALSGEA